jgi:hypothetical protein
MRFTWWLTGESTWSGDHDITTGQGRGVTDCLSITFFVVSRSISVNALAHTLNTWCEVVNASKRPHNIVEWGERLQSCTQDMYRHLPAVMVNDSSSYIRTLLAEIFGYDVGYDHWGKGYHLGLSGWIELVGRGRWSFDESEVTSYYGLDYCNEMLVYCCIFGA